MTNSHHPNSTQPTAEQLRSQCITIINQLYNHRLNLKLLTNALRGLEIVAAYKINRSMSQDRLKPRKEG